MGKSVIPSIIQGTEGRLLIYGELMEALHSLSPIEIEEKKTCLHVVAGGRAFLGVHPRKAGLRVTLVMRDEIRDPRILKAERASKNRVYNDLNLLPGDCDEMVKGWLREAYELCL